MLKKQTWKSLALRLVEDLAQDKSGEYVELQDCIMDFVWGAWIMMYPTGWAGSIHPDSLTILALTCLMPWWFWSLIFISSGILHVIVAAKEITSIRRIVAFTSMCTWLYVSVYLGLTDFRMIVVPVSFILALGSAWSYWRLSLQQWKIRSRQTA